MLKTCRKCKESDHKNQFISLQNGKETITCRTCRDKDRLKHKMGNLPNLSYKYYEVLKYELGGIFNVVKMLLIVLILII